ncbi:MAG: hypothetical protein BWY14_00203 [Parcubacteria group bacterium ADurb.Bin192]|nr:MAG: hypothetical protein BWY14_00203 [Parcubacteria group bacterium ADurb.Bin192]
MFHVKRLTKQQKKSNDHLSINIFNYFIQIKIIYYFLH